MAEGKQGEAEFVAGNPAAAPAGGSAPPALPNSFSGGNVPAQSAAAGAYSALKAFTKEVLSLRVQTGHLDSEGNKRQMTKERGKI